MPYVTIEQAGDMWCPEVRVALQAGMAANWTTNTAPAKNMSGAAYANIYAETRCQATGCMMWRWSTSDTTWKDHVSQATKPPPRHGYCGKAGRPNDG